MRPFGRLMIAAALSAGLYLSPAAVQGQVRPKRRAVEKVAPIYPEIAQRAHIQGVVKMEVVVRANGSVKVIGGSPALLQSATEAVHQWKCEPAAEESTAVVQIVFEQR